MPKKLRILFTIPNFDRAGSGKVVYDLIKGLDPEQFSIEIACRHDKGHLYKAVKALGYPIHLFDTTTPYRPYYSLLFRIWKISRFYKTHEYDLIHSWQWSSDWTEVLAARLTGIKWIYTKKAMSWGNIHWKLKSYLAHYIITINSDMQAYFPKKKHQALIPLGIDTDYYNSEHFTKQPNSKIDFSIITVANLVPVKGLEVLLKALKILNNRNIHLFVVGNTANAYGDAMKLLTADLGLDQQVSFLERQSDVRPYIASADLYVIPTLNQGRKEGMPMALVEAMSMGIPILGSDISGINYVLQDFKALLFEAGNSQALANKIQDVFNMSSSERDALGMRLRDYCISHFQIKKFISAHEQLYKTLLNQS